MNRLPVIFVFLAACCSKAWSDPLKGIQLNRPVVDQARFLDKNTTQILESLLLKVKNSSGTQIGVVTLPALEGETVEQIAIKIADKWQLGDAQADNGVLLVIAKKEKKIRIEVGQGLEGSLTDAYSKRVIDYRMTPLFKQGRYGEGIFSGVFGILEYTNPDLDMQNLVNSFVPERRSRTAQKPGGLGSFLYKLIVLFFVIISFSLRMFFPFSTGFVGGYGRRYGGGGGFGGGGFGGGGGGFSGGGASGGW